MSEMVEVAPFAGGGSTVATENFVPSSEETCLTSPSGMCWSPSGSLLVSDGCLGSIFSIEGGRTHLITAKHEDDHSVYSNSIGNPCGLACMNDGSILVADMQDHTIKRILNDKVSILAGQGTIGDEDGSFKFSRFNKPKSLCPTPPQRGDLLVSEIGSHRIRVLLMEPQGLVLTIAGQGHKGHLDGNTETALFNYPSGLCCMIPDPSYMYLAQHPITPYIGEKGISWAQSTSSEFLESPPPQEVYTPTRKLIDRVDDLMIFVSDTCNHRIRLIHNAWVNNFAGNGVKGLADGPCNLAQFDHPGALCMAYKSILVADNRNDRIRLIDLETNLVRSVALTNDRSAIFPQPTVTLQCPTVMCMGEYGDVYVSCEFETHSEIRQLSHFTPPTGHPFVANMVNTVKESISPETTAGVEDIGERKKNGEETPSEKESEAESSSSKSNQGISMIPNAPSVTPTTGSEEESGDSTAEAKRFSLSEGRGVMESPREVLPSDIMTSEAGGDGGRVTLKVVVTESGGEAPSRHHQAIVTGPTTTLTPQPVEKVGGKSMPHPPAVKIRSKSVESGLSPDTRRVMAKYYQRGPPHQPTSFTSTRAAGTSSTSSKRPSKNSTPSSATQAPSASSTSSESDTRSYGDQELSPDFIGGDQLSPRGSTSSEPSQTRASTQPMHSNPWGIVSGLARMMSWDAERTMVKVDSILEHVGLREASTVAPQDETGSNPITTTVSSEEAGNQEQYKAGKDSANATTEKVEPQPQNKGKGDSIDVQ